MKTKATCDSLCSADELEAAVERALKRMLVNDGGNFTARSLEDEVSTLHSKNSVPDSIVVVEGGAATTKPSDDQDVNQMHDLLDKIRELERKLEPSTAFKVSLDELWAKNRELEQKLAFKETAEKKNAGLKSKLEAQSERITKLQEAHRKEVAELNKVHSQRITQVKREKDERIVKLQEARRKEVAELKKVHSQRITQMSENARARAWMLERGVQFYTPSISTLSETMSEAQELDHVDLIEGLTSELKNLNTTAAVKNVSVDGVDYSSDILLIHELIKSHKLIYNIESSPVGKWVWKGLREIKKKGGDTNPTFALPDGIATFYGNLNYSYSVLRGDVNTSITHDVIACSPILLDAKARGAPKNNNSGVYGVDWWNIYMPIKLLKKLTDDIKRVSGYILNQEGVIMDESQGLVSITVNIKDENDSPNITMITTVNEDDEEEVEGEELTEGNDEVEADKKKLEYTDMGTLRNIMAGGGEEFLIGGLGFFTVGVSCKGNANEEPPPAGTYVKLSLKMKAFHALHIIEEGVRRVSYRSSSAGLKY